MNPFRITVSLGLEFRFSVLEVVTLFFIYIKGAVCWIVTSSGMEWNSIVYNPQPHRYMTQNPTHCTLMLLQVRLENCSVFLHHLVDKRVVFRTSFWKIWILKLITEEMPWFVKYKPQAVYNLNGLIWR